MLTFIDIIHEGHKVQGVCDFGKLKNEPGGPDEFRRVTRGLRRGDIISEFRHIFGL